MARKETTWTQKITDTNYTCDVCGEDLGDGDIYDRKKVEIGYIGDERYENEEVSFDICVECFQKHVEPVLLSIGAIKYKKQS